MHTNPDISMKVLGSFLTYSLKRQAFRSAGGWCDWRSPKQVEDRRSHKTLEKHPLALSQTNTPENVKDNQATARRWFLFRAGRLWLRAAARLTLPRCWPSDWQGCHGDQGTSAWGRRPAAEDLPTWRFLCIRVNEKSFPCAALSNFSSNDQNQIGHISNSNAIVRSTCRIWHWRIN